MTEPKTEVLELRLVSPEPGIIAPAPAPVSTATTVSAEARLARSFGKVTRKAT